MNTKEWFVGILYQTELINKFIKDFSIDNTLEGCFAEYNHLEGWYFDSDCISYRVKDLFDDYSEGYNWYTTDSGLHLVIKIILLSHGWEKDFEGGDEEDGLIVYKMFENYEKL